MTLGPLILGATGQVGTAFRTGAPDVFAGQPIWQSRRPIEGHLHWDILNAPAPDVACSGILSFAGSSKDSAEVHIALAKAACDMGARLGVPVLLASSQSVYGVQEGAIGEEAPCLATGDYGRAKFEMERSVAGRSGVTCLRIGNLPGCDMLFRAAKLGPVALDQWPDGQGPRRSMIGLRSLAQVCAKLLMTPDLPAVLNVAQPRLVTMQSLLEVAKVDWHWKPAPETVVKELELDLTELSRIVDLPEADPAQMVAEARACGAIA